MDIINLVVKAIADAKDKEPDELDIVLQNYVDTDALQRLHTHKNDAWRLEFDLPGHTVRVTGEGSVFVDGTRHRTIS